MKATWLLSALAVLLLVSYTAVTQPFSDTDPRINCTNAIHMPNCSFCNVSELLCSHLKVSILPTAEVNVLCTDAFDEFPHLNIEKIRTYQLNVENCKPPEDEPLMESLSFLDVKNIKKLTYTNLETIIPYTAGFFEGLHDLENLTLQIRFEQVKLDVFNNLPRLNELTIYHDNPNLQLGIFDSLVELSTLLFISSAEITELQSGIFRNQRKLKKLVLSFQKLSWLNQDTFQGLQNLESLDLDANRIGSLSKNTFGLLPNLTTLISSIDNLSSIPVNLTENRKLEIFKLRFNKVSSILPSHFLSHLPELKEVDLSSSRFHDLPETLFHGSRAITKVCFFGSGLEDVPALLLRDQWNLEYLDLRSNLLRMLPRQFFATTKNLEILRLSGNGFESLTEHDFAALGKLKELHLDRNRFHYLDFVMLQGTTSLEKLFLQQNLFKNVPDWKNFFSSTHSTNSVNTSSQLGKISLKLLDLSNNEISNLTGFDFNIYSDAININLSHNKISSIYIDNVDRNMSHVVVDLTGNPLNCDCQLLNFHQYVMAKNESHINFLMDDLHCRYPAKLYGTPFSYLKNEDLICPLATKEKFKCPPKCDCVIRPIDLTIIVNCSGQGLTKVPSLSQPSWINYTFIELHIENNFIRKLPTKDLSNYEHVRELHARNNRIEMLLVHNIPSHLHLVDLRYNKLTTMDKTILDTFVSSESLKSMYLSNNPWICDCTNQDFIRFVQQNRLKLSADKSPIICEDGTTVDSIDVGELCGENTRKVLLISLTSAFSGLLIGLLFALYYYYQTEIKVWLFTHNLLLCLVTEEELDKDKEYDAFVSYCHKDAQFIEDILVPRMETEMNFKICVHERDWIPGEMIPDQIISSVENSRRTIVVLSKHYLESTWAQMEFQTAYLKSQAEKRVRIIIIIVGEIEDVHSLGPELEAYLKMNTYVKYDDRWFWDKLRYAMPHPVAVAEVEMQTNRRSA